MQFFFSVAASCYNCVLFIFLSFHFQGSAYHITELLVEKIGKANVLLDHPVTAIKHVRIKLLCFLNTWLIIIFMT